MNKYDVVKTIGEGAYGVVLQCRNKETCELVAIKRFKESDEDELVRKTTLREVRILRLLKDEPYVVRLQEAFRRKGKLYLVFDYVGCNLLDVLEQHPQGLPTEDIRRMVFTMLLGIRACHANGVIHRDIKPENLLVHEDNTLRLCDFGFARVFTNGMDDLTDYVATRWYRSPELLLGTTNYGLPSDMWAVGCIMAELIDGQAIFPCETEVDQLFVIQKLLGNYTQQQTEMFRKNPRFNGYTLKEIPKVESSLERKYTKKASKKALSLLKQMLVIDPSKRCTVDEALSHPFFEGLAEVHYPQLKSAAPAMRPPSANVGANGGASGSGSASTKIPALARPPSSLAANKQQRVSTPSESHMNAPVMGDATFGGQPFDDGGGEHDGSALPSSGGGRGPSPWGGNTTTLPRPNGAVSGGGGQPMLPPARIASANRQHNNAANNNDGMTSNRVLTPGHGIANGQSSAYGGATTGVSSSGVQGMIVGNMGMGGLLHQQQNINNVGTAGPSNLNGTMTSYGSGGGTTSTAGSFGGRSSAVRLPMAPIGPANSGPVVGMGTLPRINFTAGFTGVNAPPSTTTAPQQQDSTYYHQQPQQYQPHPMASTPAGTNPSQPQFQPTGYASSSVNTSGVYAPTAPQQQQQQPNTSYSMRYQSMSSAPPAQQQQQQSYTSSGAGGMYRTTDLVNGGQLPPRSSGLGTVGGVYSTDPSKAPPGGSAGYRPRLY